MVRFVLFATLLAQVAAAPINKGNSRIPATSDIGINLLSKARKLDGDEENDWIGNYSIIFEKCLTVLDSGFGGDEEDEAANRAGYAVSGVVEFRLCPSDYCYSGCSGGLYAVSAQEFVRAVMEAKLMAQEEACENVRENCYNDDENYCFAQAGLDYCIEEEGEEKEDMERYLECAEVEKANNGNNNGNYYNGEYRCYNDECNLFVGAMCSSDGSAIHLGAFIDEECRAPAPEGSYEAFNYGYSLPYSSESMVDTNCTPCKIGEEYNGDGEIEYQISDLCVELYESSIKCESNVTDSYYKVTSGCYYIETMLPKFAEFAASNDFSSMVYWSVLPVLALGFAGVSKYYHSKLQRTQVKLSDQGIANGVVA